MPKAGVFAIAAVAVLTMMSLVYFAVTFEPTEGTTTVVLQPPVPPRAEVQTPEQPAASSQQNSSPLPQIRIQPQPAAPVVAVQEPEIAPLPEEAQAAQEQAPQAELADNLVVQLPSLTDSDSFVFTALSAFKNGAVLIDLLAEDQVIRKFVVFVENISRGEFPQTGLPYKNLGREMPVRNVDENLFVMEEVAHTRFDDVIRTFTEVDIEASIALYQLISPLFQQAYAEIGFRNVSFDETLRDAINNVLRTTNMEGPYQLVKPSVMYLYADAEIENLLEVQKQLIRIGPNNTSILKAKLREFVSQL